MVSIPIVETIILKDFRHKDIPEESNPSLQIDFDFLGDLTQGLIPVESITTGNPRFYRRDLTKSMSSAVQELTRVSALWSVRHWYFTNVSLDGCFSMDIKQEKPSSTFDSFRHSIWCTIPGFASTYITHKVVQI